MPDTCLMKNIALTLENLNKTAPISLTYVLDASGRPTFPTDSGEIAIDISGVFSGGAGPQGVDVSGSGCGTYQVLDMLISQVQIMKNCIKKHEVVLEAKLAIQLQKGTAPAAGTFDTLACGLDGELDPSANPCNKYFNKPLVPTSGYPFGTTSINYVNLARCLKTRDVGYPLDISSSTYTLSRSAELRGDNHAVARPKESGVAADSPAIMLSTYSTDPAVDKIGANISENGIFELITNMTLLLMVINQGINPGYIACDWSSSPGSFIAGKMPTSLAKT